MKFSPDKFHHLFLGRPSFPEHWLPSKCAVSSLLLVAICSFALPLSSLAQWTGTNIGGASGGSSTWSPSTGTLTIAGAGTGAAISTDQLRFTSVPVSGDFKLVARVASFTGTANSQVGLAVRENMTATCSVGGIYFMPGVGTIAHPNKVVYQQRNMKTGAHYKWTHPIYNGVNTPISTPLWLQLVRVGNNFAVYRSTDGNDWSHVSNVSGAAFETSGSVNVGFVVASGGAGTVTAVLDNIYLKKTATAMLPWRTSWLGNTYGADSTSTVSADVSAMWVAPDGTCYMNCEWEEYGENGKLYKDGQVVRHSSGPANGGEGSIVGDGTGVTYAVGGSPSSLYRRVFNGGVVGGWAGYSRMQTLDPVSAADGKTRVSGLAFTGSGTSAKLYVSRAADDPLNYHMGKILVLEPNKNLFAAPASEGTMWNNLVTNPIDTTGVTDPAPEAVYQSQYEGLPLTYTIPSLTSGLSYTVRLHFAELKLTGTGQRVMNLSVAGTVPQTHPNFDVYSQAGAKFKAVVYEFDNVVAPANGQIVIDLTAVTNSPILNGIEILDPDDNVFKLINCGGNTAGAWENNVHQASSFTLPRPGPLCVDKRGNLWILQLGAPYPLSHKFSSYPGWAAIKCYSPSGTELKHVTGVVNPIAICYDDRNGADRLLVAENGPDQNIRIYTGLTGTPTCTSTFGQQGGVFSGGTPGLVYDPVSGNDARFYGLAGLGLDSAGNLYVACNGGSHMTDLKKFAVSGGSWNTTAAWKLRSLENISCGDFDPTVNASDVWSLGKHYTMNYGATTPGGEWSLKSYQWNPFQYSGTALNPPGGSTVYRKINGNGVIYSSPSQAFADTIHIYRQTGEQLAYCGRINGFTAGVVSVWVDANGNGQEDEATTSVPKLHNNAGHVGGFDVDDAGNIYLAMESAQPQFGRKPYVHKLNFGGFSGGVPQYNAANYSAVVPLAPFDQYWMGARLKYAGGASNTMYLMGMESWNAADLTYGGILARYNNWNTTPTLAFSTTLPKPATDHNFFFYSGAYPSNGFKYMSFDVAGNYAFAGELWGPVHVINATTGVYTTQLLAGPEINGLLAWQDHCMGLRAHHNAADNEYYILTENSALRGRNNFFRWKPVEKTQMAYYGLNQTSGTSVPDTSGSGNNGTLNGTVVSGTTWKGGRFENALNFNGTNNWVSLPNNLIKNYTTVAFACWFRTASPNGVILAHQDTAFPAGTGQHVPLVYIGSDSKLYGGFWRGFAANIVSPGTVTDGHWHHVALIGNVNTQSLYLDGELVGTQAGTINHSSMQYNQLGVGRTAGWPGGASGNLYFNGDLDDARFYNQALSAQDTANLAAH